MMGGDFPDISQEDDRWRAVVGRDRRADGVFCYSVSTTGVYCRPSCGARLPRRENVRFHASAEAAEQAGFRACKRCRPCGASLAQDHAAAIARTCRLIDASDNIPTLAALAEQAGLSRFHFHRLFKASVGLTPRAYAEAARVRRVRAALERAGTVTEALYDAGYNSNGRFYAAAPNVLGMTPTRFRKGGAGETIRFAVGQCCLGAILVAATDRGVSAIELGDDPEALLQGFQDRFPQAHLVGGDPAFEHIVARAVGLVASPAEGTDLPLDIRGTAFQHGVWKALMEIRPGSTASYAEIAARLGSPKAVRAVARACAANAIAVAIPCHRVVRADGALSGYRWGVARKRALLDRELQET